MKKDDDRLAVSRIYEESWKYAYKGIVPQDYLESIPTGGWASGIDKEGMHTLLLTEDDIFAGTSSYGSSRFSEYNGWGEIVSIYLLPRYMGRGYGRQLLRAVIGELVQLGFQDAFLWVLEDNWRARRFYAKEGFLPDGNYMECEIGGKRLREAAYCKHIL